MMKSRLCDIYVQVVKTVLVRADCSKYILLSIVAECTLHAIITVIALLAITAAVL